MNLISFNKKISILVIFSLVFSLSGLSHASQCLLAPEVGHWENSNTSNTNIRQVFIKQECVDVSTSTCNGDICTIKKQVKSVFTMRLWAACGALLCNQGDVEGVKTSANWLFFNYGDEFVWAKIWSGSDNWVQIVAETPDQSKTLSNDWFFRTSDFNGF